MIDVAIVGCGPTGAYLGNLLGARGVRVVILERQQAIYDLPRAVHFDGEVMRLFQSAGLADAVAAICRVNPGMLFKDAAGRVLVDWSRDMAVGPMGWHESYRFHQPALEAVLRAGLTRFADVSFRAGVEVRGVRQDADGVTLEIDGAHLRARYVVACDGAGSGVRQRLDLGWEDLGFEERWLVVDLDLTRARPDLGDYSIQYCDAAAPATYVRGVGARRRWEMRIGDGDPERFSDAEVWGRLARWIGPEEARLERAAVYTFRSRLAERWRAGRVFLAGDAAHQMPPFMGQGMCAGIRDAGNLAWKLAAVCAGADAGLLESYLSERKPNARAFVQLSAELGQVINGTARGEAPDGRMTSIWPGLGAGLGVRDGIAGDLVPQVDRADDGTQSGFYVLARGPLEANVPVVVGGQDWLEARGLFGVLVRPDGYALAGGKTDTALVAEVARFGELMACMPARDGQALAQTAQ